MKNGIERFLLHLKAKLTLIGQAAMAAERDKKCLVWEYLSRQTPRWIGEEVFKPQRRENKGVCFDFKNVWLGYWRAVSARLIKCQQSRDVAVLCGQVFGTAYTYIMMPAKREHRAVHGMRPALTNGAGAQRRKEEKQLQHRWQNGLFLAAVLLLCCFCCICCILCFCFFPFSSTCCYCSSTATASIRHFNHFSYPNLLFQIPFNLPTSDCFSSGLPSINSDPLLFHSKHFSNKHTFNQVIDLQFNSFPFKVSPF